MKEENTPNLLSGATEELILGTASDVVDDVAKKTRLFDTARDELFPRFESGGVLLNFFLCM